MEFECINEVPASISFPVENVSIMDLQVSRCNFEFYKLKAYILLKASLKTIFSREGRTEKRDLKDITHLPSAARFEVSKRV